MYPLERGLDSLECRLGVQAAAEIGGPAAGAYQFVAAVGQPKVDDVGGFLVGFGHSWLLCNNATKKLLCYIVICLCVFYRTDKLSCSFVA